MHIQTNMTALPPVNAPNDVFALAIRDEGLYAGFNGGVAFFDGQTWTPRVNGLHVMPVLALVSAGEWLIAGGKGGIARSNDSGEHWQPAQVPPFDVVQVLAVSPQFEQDHTLLAGTNDKGILRSDDGGLTWTETSFGLLDNYIVDLMWDENTLLALSYERLYRSPNAGRAWKTGIDLDEADEFFECMSRLPDGSLLAVSGSSSFYFHSSDQGVTWTRLQETSVYHQLIANNSVPVRGIVSARKNNDAVQITTDSGTTWTRIENYASLPRGTNQRHVYALKEGRLVISEGDFTKWATLTDPPVLHINHVILFKGNVFAFGKLRHALNFLNGEWKPVRDLPHTLTARARYQDKLYAWLNDTLYYSTDGNTWDSHKVVLANRFMHLSQLAFLSDQVIYASGWDGSFLARTTDGGKTWQTTPSPFGMLPVLTLHANPHLIFAATFDPRRKMIALWRSMDGGQKWYPGAEVPSEWGIAAGFSDPAMIALPGIVLVSGADPNAAWTRAAFDKDGSPLTNIQVRMITGDEKIQFALTLVDGIYVSRDRGMHWSHLALELPEDQLMDISYDPDTEHLAVLSVGAHVHLIELNLEE